MSGLNQLTEQAYQQLLTSHTSASIACVPLSVIESAVADMRLVDDNLAVHRIATGVERLAFDELERQWVDYRDARGQYVLP